MAIKIIQKGRLPENEIYVGTCYHCKTRAEWLRSDDVTVGFYGNTPLRPLNTKIKCPVCETEITGYPAND